MIAATLLQAQAPMVTNPVAIFLVVLAIILIVPLLLQRIKLPYVIGLILAGVAVGPHGFNIVGRDMSFEVFGQVGILYLMFLAGLEIDMYHLRRNLRRGLVFGAYTFVIPLVVGLGVGLGLLGLGVKASFLLAAMFAAHTLLAYPIVSRFGLTRNNAVVVAVAGTIFTVVGSLVVLAIVGEVADKGSFSALSLLRVTGYIAVFCLVTILVYPRLTRWFFKRYSDTIAQFVYVLVMVFLAATVAIRLGIEGVFGAFIAGLVLNRYVPLRSALMVRIEFVGNALFIPYFLIGVGMMIDLGVLTRGWGTLYVAAIMSVAAMAAKWLAAFATQKTFGMPALERSILYQLSNAHTAVALAVVTIGLRMNLLGEEILNGTVVMILATCTVSSIGVERASRRLKLRQLRSGADNVAENLEKHPPRTLITVANPITAPSLVELAMMIHQGGKSTPDSPIYALYVRGSDHSDASRAIGRNALSVAEKSRRGCRFDPHPHRALRCQHNCRSIEHRGRTRHKRNNNRSAWPHTYYRLVFRPENRAACAFYKPHDCCQPLLYSREHGHPYRCGCASEGRVRDRLPAMGRGYGHDSLAARLPHNLPLPPGYDRFCPGCHCPRPVCHTRRICAP